MPFGDMGVGIVGLILFIVGAVALILWFFLPFAVFGIKDKLDQMIAIGQRGNAHLRDIDARLATLEAKVAPPSQSAAPNSLSN